MASIPRCLHAMAMLAVLSPHSSWAQDTTRIGTRTCTSDQITVTPSLLERRPALVDGLRAEGAGGVVALRVMLDTSGHADSTTLMVLMTSDHALDAPARLVVLASRYAPASLGGRPVSCLLTALFEWKPGDRGPTLFLVRNPGPAEEKPAVMMAPLIDYPPKLRKANVEGRVLLQGIIDTSGYFEPESIRVLQTPDSAFIGPLRQWMRNARFYPARLFGHPVRALVQVPFDFMTHGQPPQPPPAATPGCTSRPGAYNPRCPPM